MPTRPDPDPTSNRLAAALADDEPDTNPPPPPVAPARPPAAPRRATVKAVPMADDETTDESMIPPEIVIWGPPVDMTSWTNRVPTKWQRWAKRYFAVESAQNNLPEGVLPKVIAQFVTDHREEIVRRAVEAAGSDD